ncbi:MAG: aminomethyltransferase beta-barrel domain-containing protein, partial [Minisyncoccia bacterium]
ETNTLVVARGSDNPALFRKEAEIMNLNFIEAISNAPAQGVSGATPKSYPSREHRISLKVIARVRYRQPLIPATLIEEESGKYKLVFKKPVKFVAPGQSAVFYESGFFAGLRGRRMLGGGIIL